jgi:hypothetical protein
MPSHGGRVPRLVGIAAIEMELAEMPGNSGYDLVTTR